MVYPFPFTPNSMIMQTYTLEGHEPSFLPEGKQWKLVWHDEFDGTELDRSKWDFRLNFWGRRFAAYTDEGIVLDGKSHLEIHLVEHDGQFCSAQLQTGANSFDAPSKMGKNPWGQTSIWPLAEIKKPTFMHRYGYYEVLCKLQKKPGWWSAFWLQSPSIGTAYNPEYCGVECDIMECFGLPEATSGNIFGGYGSQYKEAGRVRYNLETDPEGWHRFGVDWSKDGYVFYCDGKETSRTSAPVSRVEQFILLTTECQGYRHGNMDTPSDKLKKENLPDCFTVDHVRVFDQVD